MKLLVTGVLALSGAMWASGCGGGAGPAVPPFGPFGIDPPGSTSEPAGGSNETPPASGAQTIPQLCAAVCPRIAAACPGAAMADCVSGCEADQTMYPACVTQLQAFLECIDTASLTCGSSTSIDAPTCMNDELALVSCINPGSTVYTTGAAQ